MTQRVPKASGLPRSMGHSDDYFTEIPRLPAHPYTAITLGKRQDVGRMVNPTVLAVEATTDCVSDESDRNFRIRIPRHDSGSRCQHALDSLDTNADRDDLVNRYPHQRRLVAEFKLLFVFAVLVLVLEFEFLFTVFVFTLTFAFVLVVTGTTPTLKLRYII